MNSYYTMIVIRVLILIVIITGINGYFRQRRRHTYRVDQVKVGDAKATVIKTIGRPTKINKRTVGSRGVEEQFIYSQPGELYVAIDFDPFGTVERIYTSASRR